MGHLFLLSWARVRRFALGSGMVFVTVVFSVVDHGGVYVFHVCFYLCVVYGVGVCVNVCGVVCVSECCLFLVCGEYMRRQGEYMREQGEYIRE